MAHECASYHSDLHLEEATSCSYAPLPDEESVSIQATGRRKSIGVFPAVFSAICFFSILALALNGNGGSDDTPEVVELADMGPLSRGVTEGVSEKSAWRLVGPRSAAFPWTNDMLSWQRTAYHFQPEKNWMNDPNGPLFYKGWYHLFYQYNPDSAVWGNITWGHAISKDLVHWLHLPLAMVPDRWYDINGVWTGSATLLPDGRIVMIYTGSTNASVQVQNLAFPADPADPLLLSWSKHPANPVLLPPAGIDVKDFRDPTTAWIAHGGGGDGDNDENSHYYIAIGSKVNTTGISLVYKTKDFLSYELLEEELHAVAGTGMWECVDFYPVSTSGREGLDTLAGVRNGEGVKHVLKASLDDDKHDYYAIGSYDEVAGQWSPDDAALDVGIGLRYDYGKFYASKTFYDQDKRRRVLWGWTGEMDSEKADLQKGWASLMALPRVVTFDEKTRKNLIQWPVEEFDNLRSSSKEFKHIEMKPGSVVPLEVGMTTQLDISAEFEISKEALEEAIEADVGYNCSSSEGAAGRSKLGPFGLLVLADESLLEQTAVYFYLGRKTDGDLQTFICQDELRSSYANDIVKRVHGSTVPVLNGEKFSLRILVDHSIVETFAQGGRTCITSRVYPTKAINGGARLFLFNNATGTHVTATQVKLWQMNSAFIHPYSESASNMNYFSS